MLHEKSSIDSIINYEDSEDSNSFNTEESDNNTRSSSPFLNVRKNYELTGMIYTALSAFAFSAMSFCVHFASSFEHYRFPSFQLVLFRSLGQMILAILTSVCLNVNPFGPSNIQLRSLLVFRGFFGACGLALFFFSLSVLSLGDATVIFFTGPAFTSLFAHMFLNEAIEFLDLLSVIFNLVGVTLVARPSFFFPDKLVIIKSDENIKSIGVVCALLGAIMSALAYVSVRKITKLSAELESTRLDNNLSFKVHAIVHVFYFGFISSCLSPIGLYYLQKPVWPGTEPSIPDDHREFYIWTGYGLMVLVSIFAFIGQILLNRGLQLSRAGPSIIMRNLDVVFAFVLGALFMNEVPYWTSYLGGSLILLFSFLTAFNKMSK